MKKCISNCSIIDIVSYPQLIHKIIVNPLLKVFI